MSIKRGLYFVFLLSFVFLITYVSASTPGNINTCQVLDTAGTYTLTANITYDTTCFTIVTNNVTIEGAGFNISLNNTPTGTNGIAINGTSGNIIRNISILNYPRAINISFGLNNNVSNVFIFNTTNGIESLFSNGSTLANIGILNSTTNGILLTNSNRSTLINVTSVLRGITVTGSNGIFNNITTMNSTSTGVSVTGMNNTLLNILNIQSSSIGITVSGNNNTLINANNFRSGTMGMSITTNGGTFINLTTMNVSGGPGVGIDVANSGGNSFFNHLFNYNSTNTGISIAGSNNTANDIISIRSSTGVAFTSSHGYTNGTDIMAVQSTGLGINFAIVGNIQMQNLSSTNSTTGGMLIIASNYIILTNISILTSNGYGVTINANHTRLTNLNIFNTTQGVIISPNGMNNTIMNLNSYGNGLFQLADQSNRNNSLAYSNTYGQILLLSNGTNWTVSASKNITFPGTINISENYASIDTSTLQEFNVTANITLYNINTSFILPKIFKEGSVCTECYNFTNLTAGNVTFNVTSFSNYSIQETYTAPVEEEESTSSSSSNTGGSSFAPVKSTPTKTTTPESTVSLTPPPADEYVSSEQIENGYSREIKANTSTEFSIKSSEKQEIVVHSLVVTSYNQSSAEVVIYSDPLVVQLDAGVEKMVDVDKDGKDDLIVRYDYTDGKPYIYIQALKQVVAKNNNVLIYSLVGLAVVVFIALLIIVGLRSGKKKK